MNRLLIFIASLSCAGFSAVNAEQYWIAYEGDDFPENEGWNRIYGDGQWPPEDEPDRWIEEGQLVIDTSRNDQLAEYYWLPLTDPGIGETFVAEWRVRSEILSGQRDNGVVFARDALPAHVGFHLQPDGLLVSTEGVIIPLDPTISHTYRFESSDMESYRLLIDGDVAHESHFETDTLLQSYTAWGAGTVGASSISHWDYYRYGVVPEPSALALLGLGGVAANHLKRRHFHGETHHENKKDRDHSASDRSTRGTVRAWAKRDCSVGQRAA